MRSRRLNIFTQILAFVLLIVLAGICLLSVENNPGISCSEESFSTQEDSMQKLRIGDIAKVEILDSFSETLRNDEEEAVFSRLFMRFFHQLFLILLLTKLLNSFSKNFSSVSMSNCMLSTVIVDYIHKVDGKIKY